MLTLRLLGPPQILVDEKPVNVARRKSRALLYYLGLHGEAAPGANVPRAIVVALLWPEHERAAAQQSLRTTLHGLRKVLGPALVADADSLALAADTQVDARLFEARLAAAGNDLAGLESALALYNGDLLDGFNLPDSAAFDDWSAAERERLRRLALRGLRALAGQHEARADYMAALAVLDRALTFDPLQEEVQRDALRLHYLAGDRAGAVRRYALLRRMLDDELGVLPMAETRALYDAIVADAVPTMPGLLGQPLAVNPPPANQALANQPPARPGTRLPAAGQAALPFAGRAAELEALQSLAAAPTFGGGKLALLEGEAGVGKSRLANEYLRATGGLALRGAGHEQEQSLPYQPVIEALRGLLAQPTWPALWAGLAAALPAVWLAEMSRLLPELGAGQAAAGQGGPPDEARLWEGLHQFLLALSRQHPVVLFLDDLHWADTTTLALLGYLTRRAHADAARLICLAAARPAPRGPAMAALLQTLTREERLLRLPLGRLEAEAIGALTRQWLAGRPGDQDMEGAEALAAWLGAASEGNPYVLAELLRYLEERGYLGADGRPNLAALDGSPVVPPSIYSLIQSRLARLSEAGRGLLDAAVAAGREFEFEVIYRAAGLSEAQALDALDEIRAAGLFTTLPPGAGGDGAVPLLTRFVFDHSLTMEVAYREVGEPRHRQLHRRMAEALEQVYGRQRLDSIAGLLAMHYDEAGAPKLAAPYALRAAQLASGVAAWAEAATFYERALQAEARPAERLTIGMALGAVQLKAGHGAQASDAFQQALGVALALGAPSEIEQARLALARSLLTQARFSEVVRLARQVQAQPLSSDAAASAEFIWGTVLSIEGADLDGAAEHLKLAEDLTAEAIAQGQAGRARLAQVKFEQGSVAAQQGDLALAIALYRQSLQIAQACRGDDESLGFETLAHNNLAYHLHLLRADDPEALEHVEAGLRLARENGVLWLMPFLLSTLGEIRLALGSLDDAEKAWMEGLSFARQMVNAERVAGITANLGLLARARGDDRLALYRLSTALAQTDALGTQHQAAQIRLWLLPLLPPGEAHTRLAEARAIAEAGGRRRLLKDVVDWEAKLAADAG